MALYAKERDEYKCQVCGASEKLCVHHVFPAWKFPEKKYELDNHITICKFHHMKVQAYNTRNKTYLSRKEIKHFDDMLEKEKNEIKAELERSKRSEW
jgi:5-methylcytosine-specific restriction endonuclease McrA